LFATTTPALVQYGYDTIHSGLVLFPVNSNANEDVASASIIDTASLQAWFHFRGVAVSAVDAMDWVYDAGLDVFEYGLLSASFGYVSIIPDTTGYGESADLVPSDLNKKSAVTGSLPLYAFAQSYVFASSGGRTVLLKEALYMGCSGGGYRSIAAADGMRSHGITPVKVMAGSAPLKTRSWTPMGFLRSESLGISGPFDPLSVGLASLAFSNTRPGVANYNTGQSFLKEDKVETLLAMFQDLDAPSLFFHYYVWSAYVLFKYPGNLKPGELFLSEPVVEFFTTALANNDTDPCINNPSLALDLNVDKTCEAMDENDLTQAVLEADYPIELCHSKTDALIVIENVPAPEYLKFELDGPGHGTATLICDALLFGNTEIVKPLIRPIVKAAK
jgi:rhodanese-related sulfurtransferase